jgi:dihydrofolate reductase
MMEASGRSISLILAVARNGAIGMNNKMLWHIPEDFRWFKKHTSGHPVIMGRKTWESLPKKPLPGRKNIVITTDAHSSFPGAVRVGSVEESLAQMDSGGENFIIGGGAVYRQFLPLAQKTYLTLIDRDYEADVWFAELDPDEWRETYREHHPEHQPAYTFLIFERIS